MDIKPLSVEELNLYIKNKVQNDEFLNNVYVKGEISNCKLHYSGHIYFTLKDEKSLIKCVMFRGYASRLNFTPKDGMKVLVFGTVAVYERDGVYQIYAKAMKQDGIGTLYEAYEKLKKQLEAEGLFAPEHKKRIPMYSKTIGVLTASTGAVIRDIINVSTRRNPNVHIRLLPVPVQGKDAAPEIVKGIERMNNEHLADVIILGRGGGSLEDLWPFNEEIVARAIYNSEIPIISAVGHETDFSISDFVADLRAPTPSAAAELAVPNIDDVIYTLDTYENRFKVDLKKKVQVMNLRYEKCMTRRVFKEPLQKINEREMNLDVKVKELVTNIKNKMNKFNLELVKNASKLDSLSPLKTLSRGYSITEKDGKIVKKAANLKKDDKVSMRFTDGSVEAKVL
jgi:exodeoxyribonuclease VII large subunit